MLRLRSIPLLYVPTIDFGPYLAGTPEGKARVAAEVARACTDIGLLIVTNHGVDSALTDKVVATAKALFALLLEEKMEVGRPAPDVPRGYSPIASESVSYGSSRTLTPGDLKESRDIGPSTFRVRIPITPARKGRYISVQISGRANRRT